MNVAGMMTTVVVPGSAQGNIMVGAPQEFGGIGNLFAMQMGNALQSLQQPELTISQPEEMSDQAVEQLAELLALIQQLLTGDPAKQQEAVNQLEEKWSTLSELTSNWQQTPRVLPEHSHRLIATFTQQGLSAEQAAKLVDLLASLAKPGETTTLTSSQQLVAKQLHDILSQLGIPIPKDTPKVGPAKQTGTMAGMFQPKTGFPLQGNQSGLCQGEVATAYQPLRISKALSTYQAEAGVRIRTGSLMPEQPLQMMVQPNADAQPDESLNPSQAPVGILQGPAGQGTGQLMVQAEHRVHAQHLVQQVSDLFVKQLKVATNNGVSEAKLILYPQSLGQVDVTITSHNGVITAQFTAETASGKELLDNQLPQLRAALAQQGLQVDKLEVTQQQTQSFSFQQQKEQSRQQHDERRQQQQKEEQTEFSFDALVDRSESLSTLWNRLRNAAGAGYTA